MAQTTVTTAWPIPDGPRNWTPQAIYALDRAAATHQLAESEYAALRLVAVRRAARRGHTAVTEDDMVAVLDTWLFTRSDDPAATRPVGRVTPRLTEEGGPQ